MWQIFSFKDLLGYEWWLRQNNFPLDQRDKVEVTMMIMLMIFYGFYFNEKEAFM